MYVQQIKNGVEEYKSTDWTDSDATIDRAIGRLDKKMLDNVWHWGESNWDLIRIFVELRKIRADNPKKAGRINLEMYYMIDRLNQVDPYLPLRLSSLEGIESPGIDFSLSCFMSHMDHLNSMERKKY